MHFLQFLCFIYTIERENKYQIFISDAELVFWYYEKLADFTLNYDKYFNTDYKKVLAYI